MLTIDIILHALSMGNSMGNFMGKRGKVGT